MNLSEQNIYETMARQYEALAGFAPDEASDIALRLHAVAGRLAAFGEELARARADASPLTASGEALEGFALLRGLSRKPAGRADGTLVFRRGAGAAEAAIPAGTVCLTADGAQYETAADALLAAGEQTVSVPARAVRPGADGNALPGTINRLARPLGGIGGVENPAAFSGGDDAEDDAGLRRRLLASCQAPNNGANAAYYREQAEAFEGISSAAVQADGAGGVVVSAAADGRAEVPQGTLDALAEKLSALREPCAPVTVRSATATAVDLTVSVEPAAGADPGAVFALLAQRLRGALDRMPVGARLTRARLAKLLLEGGLAENFTIAAPAADVVPPADGVLRAGEITVTGMGG